MHDGSFDQFADGARVAGLSLVAEFTENGLEALEKGPAIFVGSVFFQEFVVQFDAVLFHSAQTRVLVRQVRVGRSHEPEGQVEG